MPDSTECQVLRFIPLSEPKLVRQLGIVKRADRSLPPQAQALEQAVLDQVGKEV